MFSHKRELAKIYPAIFILSFFAAYLIFALSSLHKPLMADEIFFASDADRLQYGEIYVAHPPPYHDILRFLVRIFGFSHENLRLFGIFSFFLAIYLIYFIGKEVSKGQENNKNIGLLACFLYAVHPMAIQGSLILDIDNTILTVFLAFFILYFTKTYRDLTFKSYIFLGLLFFASLGAKFTTPFALILAMLLFYCFNRQAKTAAFAALLIGIIGIGLFLLSWAIYSSLYDLSFLSVFKRSLSVLFSSFSFAGNFAFAELLKRAARLFLWIGPFLLALSLIVVIQRLRNYHQKKILEIVDFCLIYIGILFFGYLLIGGISFQFPKYQFPLLSILTIIAANFIYKLDFEARKQNLLLYGIVIIFFISYNMIFGKDLLYLFNYTLREALVFTPLEVSNVTKDILLNFSLSLIPFILTFMIIKVAHKRYNLLRTIVLSLLIVTISSNLSLNIIQAKANYSTAYCYGRDIREMKAMEGFLKEVKRTSSEGAIIMGPEDILYEAKILSAVDTFNGPESYLRQYQYDVIGSDRTKFIEAITDQRVACVAYSISWNTISAYENIFFHEDVWKILQDNYEPKQIGTYTVWLRRKALGEKVEFLSQEGN